MARRDDDFVAAKLLKIFFPSFRGLGDAGDWGGLENAGFGVPNPSSGMPGDLGLLGLMGPLPTSFPGLPRMANDNVDDLGIFLSLFGGRSHGCSNRLAQAA